MIFIKLIEITILSILVYFSYSESGIYTATTFLIIIVIQFYQGLLIRLHKKSLKITDDTIISIIELINVLVIIETKRKKDEDRNK